MYKSYVNIQEEQTLGGNLNRCLHLFTAALDVFRLKLTLSFFSVLETDASRKCEWKEGNEM